jgi:signal transduction histidine kinase
VKHMVEAMRGKVWVESELGRGSTFTVSLPRAS